MHRKFPLLIMLISLLWSAISIVDPSHFSQQLRSILPNNIKLVHKDIARTVNGYTVMMYGLTSIANLPQKFELSDFSYYQSSLILSYMHATDQNAVNLLYGFIVNMVRNLNQDYYMQLVLNSGFIWLVPFISIDAFQMKQLTLQTDTANKQIKITPKNMNKYPDNNRPLVDCEKTHPGNFSGVNLNYNFLRQNGSQYYNLCGDLYAGPAPFSEMETSGIKKLFELLDIRVVIDLQIGSDTWVYPSKDIWANGKFNYLYKDVLKKLQKSQIKLEQQPTSILGVNASSTSTQMTNQSDKILGQASSKGQSSKSFTGGFINWSGRNSLSFKYLINSHKQGNTLKQSINAAFSVMAMLLKKNAPIYNKYRNIDSNRLYVQNICAQEFVLKVEIISQGQSVSTEYNIGLGSIVELNIQPQSVDTSKPDQSQRIKLSVLGTYITQQIKINELPTIESEIAAQLIPHPLPRAKEKKIFLFQIIFIIVFVLVVIAAGLVLSRFKSHKEKISREQYSALREEQNLRF